MTGLPGVFCKYLLLPARCGCPVTRPCSRKRDLVLDVLLVYLIRSPSLVGRCYMHTVLKCNECSQHLSETPDAGSSANDGDLEIEPFQLSMHSGKAITGGAHHGRWKNTFKWPFKCDFGGCLIKGYSEMTLRPPLAFSASCPIL